MVLGKPVIIETPEKDTIEIDGSHEGSLCPKTHQPYEALGVRYPNVRVIYPPYGVRRVPRYICSSCNEMNYSISHLLIEVKSRRTKITPQAQPFS